MRLSGNVSGNPRGRGFLLLFFVGFLLGIFFGYMSGKDYRDYAGVLSEYYLNRYQYMELEEEQLFFYLLRERLFPVILLLLFSVTALRKVILSGYLVWIGFSFGTILTISAMHFGGKGILLCITGMLPQYLLYMPVAALVAAKCFSEGNRLLVGGAVHYLSILILLVAGIMLETWVNPILIQIFLRIF